MNSLKTVPNYLTLIRFLLVAPICYAIIQQTWLVASIIFIVAIISDMLDGYAARTLDQTSALGGLFDHATDAIFVCAGLACIAMDGSVTQWLPPLVILSFIQYALDSKALSGQKLVSSVIGRSNGIAYFMLLGCAVGSKTLGFDSNVFSLIILIASWILCLSTIISMFDRAIALWRSSRNAT